MMFNNNQVKEKVKHELSGLLSHSEISKLVLFKESSLGMLSILVSHNHVAHPHNHEWCFVIEILILLQSLRIHFYLVSKSKHHHSASPRLSWREPTVAPPTSCSTIFPLSFTASTLCRCVSANSVSKFCFMKSSVSY